MIDWILLVRSQIEADMQDDRIIALVPAAVGDAAARLGTTLATALAAAEDGRYTLAVSQYLISRLLLAARDVVQGQALPDTKGFGLPWGEGSQRPSATSDLLEMARYWRSLAEEAINHIIRENQAENTNFHMYDI